MKQIKTLAQPYVWAFIFFSSIICNIAHAEPINIAVASNFIGAAKALIKDFESSSNSKVRASYASSGKLAAQIIHGAPYDLFLSADQRTPSLLIDKGISNAYSKFTYAIGRLSLCSTKPISPQNHSLSTIFDKDYRVALANEKLAPYGRASIEALTRSGEIESPDKPWVRGENVAQVFQFLASKNVDYAFVAHSQTLNTNHIRSSQCLLIPEELYEPIFQDAILLKEKRHTVEFVNYLKSDRARKIIETYGYIAPLEK